MSEKRRPPRTHEQHLRHVEQQIAALERLAPLEEKLSSLRGARHALRTRDTRRKIELGGLVIASGVESWDASEVVGALLVMADHLKAKPETRMSLREKGTRHLAEREAKRRGASVGSA
jgi:hypothetical protein